jgi:type IV pilus assembly protein PilA
MKKLQQGFTLIELMIVVAIIGILAAIAIPAYQDYTQRAQIGEAFTIVSNAKTAIAEYYQTNGTWPDATVIGNLNLDMASPAGQYTDTVTVEDGTGVVTAVMKAAGSVGADIAGTSVTFTPPPGVDISAGKSFNWTCTSTALQKFLPKSCTGA